ncbi:hypothetical protein AVEN_271088-1 [Araneus ventricosus]|uniref:Uncharacterized protein n=1 Tax=Araneus ventricosus TaxID=182803 RepID=A0A4Y2KB47_ARAVE|nr:hypothetical protein AVEN_271088-1 [Araneus ventricosus]
MTPELVFLYLAFRNTSAEGRCTHYVCFNEQQAQKHGVPSMEWILETSFPEAEALPLHSENCSWEKAHISCISHISSLSVSNLDMKSKLFSIISKHRKS